MVKLHRVTNVEDFVHLVSEIALSDGPVMWFRGQGSGSYRLTPSVLRELVQTHDARGNPLRGDEPLRSSGTAVTGLSPERLLDEFKRRALPFVQTMPRNDFEWLFLMQHHGVPTRLLDWSTNALAALYFAAEGAQPTDDGAGLPEGELEEFSDKDIAVFCMNPSRVNMVLHDLKNPVDVSADWEEWAPYARPMEASDVNTYFPICILAPHGSARIRAQSGTFTLHGTNVWPLDYYDALRDVLHKILIPKSHAERVRSQLRLLGMTTSYIYPDLDGVAKEITAAERLRFRAERQEFLSQLDEAPEPVHRSKKTRKRDSGERRKR